MTRTLRIESDPPGAALWLDGSPAGTTPYEETFLSYGVRRVELRLPGRTRVVRTIDVARPWWEVFPLALVSDLLVPVEIHDDRAFRFTLVPLADQPTTWEQAHDAWERLRALKGRLGGEAP